ncbi:hypothetical protein OTU49_004825, partial [Cherax quadricarinatus]
TQEGTLQYCTCTSKLRLHLLRKEKSWKNPSIAMEKEDNRVTEPGAVSVQSNRSTAPQILTLNTNKAGMEGLDTERINEIIKTASEGSRFYQHKQRCQQQLDNKILSLKQAAASFTHQHIMKATLQVLLPILVWQRSAVI